MRQQGLNDMAHKILDAGEQFTQTRGFNAFSYRDIQKVVGVKTSSIHYYFPTKQDLAYAMARRYIERFLGALDDIDRQLHTPPQRLQAMGQIFVDVAKAEKLCLCGMLISDMLSIPRKGLAELRRFLKETERWTTKTIKQGIEEGHFKPTLQPERASAHFLAAMEGGVLIARIRKNADYMRDVLDAALSQLKV